MHPYPSDAPLISLPSYLRCTPNQPPPHLRCTLAPPPHLYPSAAPLPSHTNQVTYFRRALKLNQHFLSAWTLMGHEYVLLKNTYLLALLSWLYVWLYLFGSTYLALLIWLYVFGST